MLLAARKRVIRKIASCSFILRGSLRKHGNICGMPGCVCKHPTNPKPHGPYHYLSHRYKDKTQTVFLNEKKLAYAKSGINAYNRLFNDIYRLSEINFRVLRFHYDKLKDKP